ncbi:hypothetical protein M23134_00433 [Microscilla marina ATCC 23134]|uniref:Uncharacterized protein n=1 Tax=Microscilla marina ATCC 23134 TaxID=313606 RepID=A1ZJ12_MICM2|nr:hypothetical protein M23134_00433 [Microscilla marina ATCC 23134]
MSIFHLSSRNTPPTAFTTQSSIGRLKANLIFSKQGLLIKNEQL